MSKSKVRRPAYIANPQLIKRACDAVEQGLTITQAAQSINVSGATLYRWIAIDPQVKEQIDAARSRLLDSFFEACLSNDSLRYKQMKKDFLEFLTKKKAHQADT